MSSTPKWFDRVQETSSTTGTGTYTLAGAVSGFQAFAAVGNGNSCYYCAIEVDGNGNPSGGWEVGLGTYTSSGTTLSRDSVKASSNAGAAVSWAAGTRRLFLTQPAHETPTLDPTIFGVLRGAKMIRVFGSNLATGDTDLYTVPSGRRAIVLYFDLYNGGAGNGTFTAQFKVSGTYYRMHTSNTLSAAASLNVTSVVAILEAADVLAANLTTTAGMNVWYGVIEFDDSAPLKGPRLLGPSTGDNTLYTCPAGKTATLVPPLGIGTGGTIGLVADAGGTRTFFFNSVASGGSPGTTNRIGAAVGPTASNRSNSTLMGSLGAGDFLNVNVDTGNAAQVVQAFILER